MDNCINNGRELSAKKKTERARKNPPDMEKKRKNNKLPSTTLEFETNDFLSKEDQSQTGVGLPRKNFKTGTLPHANAPPIIQQTAPFFKWPYTPQIILNQSPQILRLSIPTQPTPIVLSPTSLLNPQQPQQHQQNLINMQQLQHSHQPSQLTESNGTFWLLPWPGFHVPRAACEPFIPIGTTDAESQAGGVVSGNEPQLPNFCFLGGYSHPMGVPVPWNSSWWGQEQPSLPPYALPGVSGYQSVPVPSVPNCSAAAFEQPYQRGIIHPPAKLSQKHQQMWGAQSVENVQLWTAIGQLQSEIASCRCQLMKLETEVLSLKPAVEEPPGPGAGDAEAGQTSKRGRPKRPVVLIDDFNPPDESQPHTRGRKPVLCRVQSKTKGLNSKKELRLKVGDLEKACQQARRIGRKVTIQEEKNGKKTNFFTDSNFDLQLPPKDHASSTFLSHVHQDIPRTQINGVGVNDQLTAFPILSQHVEGNDIEAAYTYRATVNGSQGWPVYILSDYSGQNWLEMGSHSFENNGSVLRQGGKDAPGWSSVNEEEASEEFDEEEASEEYDGEVAESGYNDDEEMEEEASEEYDEEEASEEYDDEEASEEASEESDDEEASEEYDDVVEESGDDDEVEMDEDASLRAKKVTA